MNAVVLRPGEGEALFDGRIVIKADFEQFTLTESLYPDARDGASPHYHRHHADAFYVLEGGLAVLVHDREVELDAGGFVCVPPGVVHGFRSTSRARFLNFHTPDGGFADNLRGRNRGEPENFDSVDAEPGSGKPPTDAVVLPPEGGERLENDTRVAWIKVGREEIALIEFDLSPEFGGPPPHSHTDHVDSFYVLDGEADFFDGRDWIRLGAGSFITAPLGAEHAFTNRGPGRARVLNIHTPSTGFHEQLDR